MIDLYQHKVIPHVMNMLEQLPSDLMEKSGMCIGVTLESKHGDYAINFTDEYSGNWEYDIIQSGEV